MTESGSNPEISLVDRAPREELVKQIQLFQTNNYTGVFLSKIPVVFIILNKYRQIVYMNQGAIDFSGLSELVSLEGQRPGEMFGCIHATTTKEGCGTSESCTYCGAINTVLKSQKYGSAMGEARLILGPEKRAFDLRIWASQIDLEAGEFTAVTLQNIQNEKRRERLESVFIHDISNQASVIKGITELLNVIEDQKGREEQLDKLQQVANNLIDEIDSHRVLNAAEKELLQTEENSFDIYDLFEELIDFYKPKLLNSKITIQIDQNVEGIDLISDRSLVSRIISNMIKNALEATNKGETITLGGNKDNSKIQIWVHNPSYIPREVQLQIFQRSFSTKGKNRGLGTYGMRMLSSYIKGEVSFITTEEEGTRFILTLNE